MNRKTQKNKKRKQIQPDVAMIAKSENANQFRDALDWFFNDKSFANFSSHGNTTWKPVDLIILAILWAWSSNSKLTGAFDDAKRQCIDLFGYSAVSSFQGLMKALVVSGEKLWLLFMRTLHDRLEQVAGKHIRISGYVPFAIDGSKVGMPRTKSNEKKFISKNYGKGKNSKYRRTKNKGPKNATSLSPKVQPPVPKILVTMIWHVALQLPWQWKLGAAGANELNDSIEMLRANKFPRNSLFIADAGFIGYPLWKTIVDQGHAFIVRVGANVYLHQEDGYRVERRKDLVYYWPLETMRRNQRPMILRLIETRVGKCKVTLLTNVLDRSELTNKMASRFYSLRWGVELEFRALKQVFERSKLRCRNGDRVIEELNWSISGMALVELFAFRQQRASKKRKDDEQISFAAALEACRSTVSNLHRPTVSGQSFNDLLNAAVVDQYQRNKSKSARYKPSTNYRPPTGQPEVRILNEDQKRKLRKIELKLAA